jgi:hypothetical protein
MSNTYPELQNFGLRNRDWAEIKVLLGCEQHATRPAEANLSIRKMS